MITRDQRPMTLAEIEAIGRIERSWERTTGYLAAGLVLSLLSSCVPVLVLTDGFAWIFTPGDIAARVAVTVALIGFAAVVAAAWLNSGHAFGLATDKAEAQVEVLHVEATGALQVGERFLLDVGEGRLLYLRGSYLADAVRRGAFPSTSFTLVRLPRAGLTLRVECHGRTLPAWTRSGRDHPRKDELSRHGDCTVMSGTLVSFAEVA